MSRIIGRKQEQALLQVILKSKEAQFVAVYGRRRVGKTYLIRSFFEGKAIFFESTGLKDGSLKDQLQLFSHSLSKTFFRGAPLTPAQNWMDAFELLTTQIETVPKGKKVVLFLDELPWMATPRSGLLQALDHYWNTRWEKMPSLKVVVCGSAASWMLENLINTKGGLYNRLTKVIRLEPFSLSETKQFLQYRKVNLNNFQITELYLAMGGIPHYLKEVEPGSSAAQSINRIAFQKNGLLFSEFNRLFSSLFSEASFHYDLVRFLSTRRYGASRKEIIHSLSALSGGTLTKRLLELTESGFIVEFSPYKATQGELWYRLIDEYVGFYIHWVESLAKRKGFSEVEDNFWQLKANSPSYRSWAGYAFETLCLKHVKHIQRALGITNVGAISSAWRVTGAKNMADQNGAQVDLLFDRDDGVITLCEIKFSRERFVVTKEYAQKLRKKILFFEEQTKTKKQISLVLITAGGLKHSIWSEGLIDRVVTLDALFK